LRPGRGFLDLEAQLLAEELEREKRESDAEFSYLFNKYFDLEEYDQMQTACEDVLDALDEHDNDLENEAVMAAGEEFYEARDRFMQAAQELERREHDDG
jgi:hypothetical protein